MLGFFIIESVISRKKKRSGEKKGQDFVYFENYSWTNWTVCLGFFLRMQGRCGYFALVSANICEYFPPSVR